MTVRIEREHIEAIARRIEPQATLLRAWPLHGGVSAQVIAFEIERPHSETRTFVLRVHGAVDRTQNPHVAEHEYRVLQVVHEAGLPVPAPVYLDPSGDVLSLPYLVIEYVDGAPAHKTADPVSLVLQMAAYLARLHAIRDAETDLGFLRRIQDGVEGSLRHPPEKMDEALREGRIRETLAAVWPLPQRNAPSLLHGDYWPGNVLWKDPPTASDTSAAVASSDTWGISSVIDWEDAAVGDPLADVANARLELLWAFGDDAMRRFTQHYVSQTDVDTSHLPYWDLYAALRPLGGMAGWGLEDAVLREMRLRHLSFTAHAFESIERRSTPASDE
jgi:aminoglycoside phosphotransferase (APT) family kinase protein